MSINEQILTFGYMVGVTILVTFGYLILGGF